MVNLTGQTVDRYHILEQIGEGGMAIVYKAYDTRLEREVAIKIIRKEAFPPESIDRIFKRFEREAKSLARLSHPNIVKVHDYGEYEGCPYLVMEYHPGGTLKAMLGKPLHWNDVSKLLIPIANALGYAHQKGILHRDVKPSNILITENNEPMLTDFGIAKMLEMSDGQTLTGTGLGVGTPDYMAPEQGLGKEVDGRVDIYSLGVILYELVTGRKPYTADTPLAVLFKHMTDPLPRPSEVFHGISEDLEKVILKALAKDPKNRYQSMAELASAIENIPERSSTAADKTAPAVEAIPVDVTRDVILLAEEKYSPISSEGRRQEMIAGRKGLEANSKSIPAPKEAKPPLSKSPWLWGIIGAGVVGLLVVRLIVVGQLPRFTAVFAPSTTPTATLTPTSTFTPTSMFTSTPTPTSTQTATPIATPIYPPIEKFAGTWKNTDPNTRGQTKIEVWTEGDVIFAHIWGKCHPSDCDNGITSAPYEGNPVKLFIDHGFKNSSYTLFLAGDTLHLTTYNHYTDNSGRSDQTLEYDFRK